MTLTLCFFFFLNLFSGIAFIRNISGVLHHRLQVAAGGPQQLSCLHTGTSLESKHWERRNKRVYPPQLPDEARRPAEIYHSRRQIKYSKDKMWYLAKMIQGMSIDQAVAQLEFNDKKGAKIMKEVLLEAQEMAVKNHNVEYKSNLYVAESYSGKGKYLKRIRYHGKGMFGIMDKVYCHFFVKLVEGSPPKVEQKTSFDQAKEYVQNLKNRTITHSL
ncbi:large ribosomal subunit protein uL22m isoform X1 [Embiotoca jacksoni]|uniref:large ribosomal subunit protein uL22m isoform X1 n=1 Tax=Embiotoca jacksoni TaxID=100190 RepID=UPI003704C127